MLVKEIAAGDDPTWDNYLDNCADVLGLQVLNFALGLPPPTDLSSADDEQFSVNRFAHDEDEALLEDEDAEVVAAEIASEAHDEPAPIPDLTQEHRIRDAKRFRTRAPRAVDSLPGIALPGQLAIIRVLWMVQAGVWELSDPTGSNC